MKNSIVWKIFRNTFLIFAILLSVQLFFQLIFFNNYFINYKVNSLKEHLSTLVYDLEETPPDEFDTTITQFAEITNSTNAIINTVQEDLLDDYNLTMVKVTDTNQDTFNVLIPFDIEGQLIIGETITLYVVPHKEKDLYLATTLTIQNNTYSIYNNEQVYNDVYTDHIFTNLSTTNSGQGKGNGKDKKNDEDTEANVDRDIPGKGDNPPGLEGKDKKLDTTDLDLNSNVLNKILADFNRQEELMLVGSILAVNEPTYRNETVFTMELMNYYLDKINGEIDNYNLNHYTIDDNHKGTYYFSETEIGRNIVFINTVNSNGVDYELFTVVSLQETDEIISLMANFNYILFGIILILLIITTVIHSKIISKPLLSLNKKANEIANLNFDYTSTGDPKRKDEIGQLSKSLDIVSANLSSSLHQLQDQNKQLKESLELENQNEQIRKDFVAGLSHEIKTPLAVIQASSEALLEDIFTDPVDQKNQLSAINKEVFKTNKLINEMVQIYRLDRPTYELHFSSFNIKELIDDLLTELKPLADTKALTVNLDLLEINVYGDRDKIEMVMSNFITNAIKYTNDDEEINISVTDHSDSILFEIENTGAHIDEEKIKHLFDPFYRLDDSRSRHLNSSGLGLYIVSLILKQHNSDFGAYNSDDGVIFYFRIQKSLDSN
ncbi:HAMP domain-containing sensor histidine kinase [Haloplasma contractile]|uniref:histidine kinase n=1 Tax=Haloplasma contractile SSD-17B TaxID=1033810 RepID=F7PWS0_9MOLU|nr:ATP-binding protein [Haloplasma contractile]ERJ12555.1 Sensor histidine kinase protein [Haloplasma contractile SSD-17B]